MDGESLVVFCEWRLFPSTHVSDVAGNRTYMVYIILTSGLFDTWRRIFVETECVSMALREELWFSSIVTQLFQRAGIPIGSTEGSCLPKGALNRTLILRIRRMDFRIE